MVSIPLVAIDALDLTRTIEEMGDIDLVQVCVAWAPHDGSGVVDAQVNALAAPRPLTNVTFTIEVKP